LIIPARPPILDFLNAGASGSYGTIVEPCAYFEKFPSPQIFYYQARGFSLAECFYLGVTNPYQGILVGEPLAAPFARPATGAWSNLPLNARLSGTTNLAFGCAAADASRPVQQADLFVDGTFLQSLTNIPPQQNNQLFLSVNGFGTKLYSTRRRHHQVGDLEPDRDPQWQQLLQLHQSAGVGSW